MHLLYTYANFQYHANVQFKCSFVSYSYLSDLSQSQCYIHLRWSCRYFFRNHDQIINCDVRTFVNMLHVEMFPQINHMFAPCCSELAGALMKWWLQTPVTPRYIIHTIAYYKHNTHPCLIHIIQYKPLPDKHYTHHCTHYAHPCLINIIHTLAWYILYTPEPYSCQPMCNRPSGFADD